MKKLLLLVAVFGLVGAGLTGCENKAETPPTTSDMPSTNAPAATNAPAQ